MKILAIANSDGSVELYTDQRVAVHVVQRPRCQTTAGECACDEYLEAALPNWVKDVYWPNNLRATIVPENIGVPELLDRQIYSKVCDVVDKLAERVERRNKIRQAAIDMGAE